MKKFIAIWNILFPNAQIQKSHKKQSNEGYDLEEPDELSKTYVFDFVSQRYQHILRKYNKVNVRIDNDELSIDDTDSDLEPQGISSEQFDNKNSGKKSRIEIKPIDALKELEIVPTPFSLTNLDDKIYMMESKLPFIKENYPKREVQSILERLRNRKKYLDGDFKEFFTRYQNTDDLKIEALLKKYNLVFKTADIFIPEFPAEASKIMEDYTNKVMELCGKKPVFYVIAAAELFKSAYKRNDPILLVQSPFGFYWQILDAWDEEMLIINEL